MKNLRITVNGTAYDVQVEELGGSPAVAAAPAPSAAAAAPAAAPKAAAGAGDPVKAPMPGTIVSVNVSNGQSVNEGDVIAVLEAMKMENILKAVGDGIIKTIRIAKGDRVEKGQVLVEFT